MAVQAYFIKYLNKYWYLKYSQDQTKCIAKANRVQCIASRHIFDILCQNSDKPKQSIIGFDKKIRIQLKAAKYIQAKFQNLNAKSRGLFSMPYSAEKGEHSLQIDQQSSARFNHAFSNRFTTHYIKPKITSLLWKSVNEKTSMAFSPAYKKNQDGRTQI